MSRKKNPHDPAYLPTGWTIDRRAPSATPIQYRETGALDIYLPPVDFLVLTSTPGDQLDRRRWVTLTHEVAPSWLEVRRRTDGTAQVIGHEGRHRADYADRIGVKWLPVTLLIAPEQGKYHDIERTERERSWGWDTPDYREDPVWQAVQKGRAFWLRTQDYRRGLVVAPDAPESYQVMLSSIRGKGVPPHAYKITR